MKYIAAYTFYTVSRSIKLKNKLSESIVDAIIMAFKCQVIT